MHDATTLLRLCGSRTGYLLPAYTLFLNKIMKSWINVSSQKVFFILLFFVFISYSNTLNSAPVLDDIHAFVEEPRVYLTDFSLHSFLQISETKFGWARYVPMLTFSLNHYFSKGSVFHFHLTNTLIHLLAASAVFLFLQAVVRTPEGKRSLRFLEDPTRFSLFVVMLWALNPVQTNAVAYLVQRMTSLAALFYLCAMAFYVQARLAAGARRFLFFLACGCASLLAFLSKENTATLPAAFVLLEVLFFSPQLPRMMARRIQRHHLLVAAVALIVLFPLANSYWQSLTQDYAIRSFTLGERVLTEVRVVVFYISLLLLPLPQRMTLDHDFLISSSWLTPVSTVFSGFFLIALLVAGIVLRKRSPLAAFGIFFFFLNLVIESSIIPLEIIFEHRLYLPSVGFFMVVIAALDWIAYRISPDAGPDSRKVVLLLMISVAALSSMLTTFRNEAWQGEFSIYEDSLHKAPNKPRTISNYGIALYNVGRSEEAMTALERSIELGGPNDEVFISSANNILNIENREKRYEKTVARGSEFFSMMTTDLNTVGLDKFMFSWGYGYLMLGRYSEALDTYVSGVIYSPQPLFLVKQIEKVVLTVSQSEAGREELGLGAREIDAYAYLVRLMIRLRFYDDAERYLDKAAALDPADQGIQRFREEFQEIEESNRVSAVQYSSTSQGEGFALRLLLVTARFLGTHYSAIAESAVSRLYTQAMTMAPGDPHVTIAAARFQFQQGHFQESLALLDGALAEHPDHVALLEEAGRIYSKLGLREPAVAMFTRLLEIYPGHPKWVQYEGYLKKM